MPMDTMELLVQLIRNALGGDERFSLPENIDWPALIQLAMSNGLDAIAFDGVQALYEKQADLSEVLDTSLGESRFDWMGLTLQAEQDYESYRLKLRDLASFWGKEGIRMLVLKGFGLSLDYPNPSHRPTGDIDVYLYGRGEEGDKLIKSAFGSKIEQNNDRHSVFQYKGLSIENHARFLDEVGHRSLSGIEQFLEQEALKAPTVSVDGVEISIPTPMMNALFLPCHMITHFVFGGMMLKQVLDWAVFVGKHGASVNWDKVRKFAEEAGRFELFRAFNGIVIDHFRVPESCLPNWGRDRALEERIWLDTLHPREKSAKRTIWNRLSNYFDLRWKYRLAYKESYFLNFFHRGWASFRGRHLPHSKSVWE